MNEEEKALDVVKDDFEYSRKNNLLTVKVDIYSLNTVLELIDRLQKELEQEKEKSSYWEQRVNDLEKEKNVVSKDKITDKIKELEDLFDKNEKEITIQYQNQFIVDVVGILEDLLKEN